MVLIRASILAVVHSGRVDGAITVLKASNHGHIKSGQQRSLADGAMLSSSDVRWGDETLWMVSEGLSPFRLWFLTLRRRGVRERWTFDSTMWFRHKRAPQSSDGQPLSRNSSTTMLWTFDYCSSRTMIHKWGCEKTIDQLRTTFRYLRDARMGQRRPSCAILYLS